MFNIFKLKLLNIAFLEENKTIYFFLNFYSDSFFLNLLTFFSFYILLCFLMKIKRFIQIFWTILYQERGILFFMAYTIDVLFSSVRNILILQNFKDFSNNYKYLFKEI